MRSLTSSFPGSVILKLLSLPNSHEDMLPSRNGFQFCLSEKESEKQTHLLEASSAC